MSTTTTTSFQLPDLPSLCSAFSLRANSRCLAVTKASEQWLTHHCNDGILDETEKNSLHGLKAGLLAALCYPTCDGFRILRLIADVLSLLFVSNARAHREIAAAAAAVACYGGDVDSCPERYPDPAHALKCSPLHHLASRLSEQPEPQRTRFSRSMQSYQIAQSEFIENQRHGIVPDLESYIELRRDLSGLSMMFDLIEHAEGLCVPHEVLEGPVMQKLKQHATDVVAWSADIVSFNLDQSRGNLHNLVSILISERHLSVQDAIDFAGHMVETSIDAFLVLERSIPDLLGVPFSDDVRLYVQGMRDIIVGSIYWNYETELYFGSRGDEIRSHRWAFLIDT